MIPTLVGFVKRPTSRHVIVNTAGNYLNVVFTAFFALLLVRIMTPAQYGVLTVLLSIAYVLANLLDFGTTATIYSYLPPLLDKKDESIHRFVKTMFFYQSLFSSVVVALLLVFFPWLDRFFFKTGAPVWELYLTAAMVMFFIWQNTGLNLLFAAKRFFPANLYLNAANLVKAAVIVGWALVGHVSIGLVLFVFGIVGPTVFFALLFVKKKALVFSVIKAGVDRKEFRFRYTLTYFLASQFYNLSLRTDLFLLSYFRSKTEVGYYGLAQKIILTVITSVTSITQVLSPLFSKAKTRAEVLHHLKTGLLYLALPSGLFLALFLLPNQVYYLFFTTKYAQTAMITKMLSLPFILFTLINLPLLFILYTVKKPQVILVANVIFFLTIAVGCYGFIPTYGVRAPPVVIAVALVIACIILSGASARYLRRLPLPTNRR